MRKHVMAAMIMKYINDVNMATGENVEVAPNGVIQRWGMYPSERYSGSDLPENWEEFLAIRKMVIPADGWRTYPGFAWVWVDADYNIGLKSINDTSWRVSNEAWSRAYEGTIRALIGDLRRSGKLEALMNHVYRHNVGIYTTWSSRCELTIFHNGRKQWLSPGGWIGDKLLYIAAEAAEVPDGRFYVAKGAGKKLGNLINEIESGKAYEEYWTPRDADFALGHETEKERSFEIAVSWKALAGLNYKYAVINPQNVELPDEVKALVGQFQRETGACQTATRVAQEALLARYQPTKAGILDWIRDNAEWFASMCIGGWRSRAIEWLTNPTEAEAMAEPCSWPEYSEAYEYADEPFDKNGNRHKVTVFLDGVKSSMIKISDADGHNPKYFHGCDGLGYFSDASDCICALERGDLRSI